MSHFSVFVRLKKYDVDAMGVDKAIELTLDPFNENKKVIFEWEDNTEEVLNAWFNATYPQVLINGEWKYSWDNGRYNQDTHGFDRYGDIYPDKVVNRFAKDIYGDFNSFLRGFYGYNNTEPGPEETSNVVLRDGRYCYGYPRWSNPKAKWDWHEIGGRYGDRFHVNGKKESFTRIGDMDLDAHKEESRLAAESFINKYNDSLSLGYFVDREEFYGTRHNAYDMGIVVCKKKEDVTEEDRKYVCVSYESGMVDILRPIEEEDKEVICYRFTNLKGYAYLDGDEWVEPGKMGWFGTSSAEPCSYNEYYKKALGWFMELRENHPDDYIAIVDCHI